MSRVFVDDDGVWRGLSKEALADYEALAASAFFRDAMARGDIVGTERVDDARACRASGPAVLRHDRIDVLSYPYEWPFEMLRDAALPPARAHPRCADREADHQGRLGLQRPVRRDEAGLHRRRLVRAAPRRRAVAGLPPVLRAVPEPAARPGAAGRAVPAAAAGQRPRHLARRPRPTCCAARGGFTKGVFTHVRLHARAERQVRRRRSRARRARPS